MYIENETWWMFIELCEVISEFISDLIRGIKQSRILREGLSYFLNWIQIRNQKSQK